MGNCGSVVKDEKRFPVVLGMATGNPKYKVAQNEALSIAMEAKGCSSLRSALGSIYSNTKIQTRYMAVPDFSPSEGDAKFFPDDGSFSMPVQVRI